MILEVSIITIMAQSAIQKCRKFRRDFRAVITHQFTISNPSSWPTMSKLQTPNDLMSSNHLVIGSSTSLLFLPFYENSDSDPIDEFQLQDQLAFSLFSTPLGDRLVPWISYLITMGLR